MKHSHTSTKASPFCKKVSHWIDLMCYAIRGLEYTEDNRTLSDELREIKEKLNHKKDVDNAISLIQALNSLINKHQQATALIPIIIHFKENILNKLNPISLEINNSCNHSEENDELQKLFTDFLKSTEQFKVPTKDEKEKKKTYDIFMIRTTKTYRRKKYAQTDKLSLARQQLRIVVKKQEYPELLRINGNVALEYVRKAVPETTNVDRHKLAKLLDDIRHLILSFAKPEFQSQLTETTLFDISRPCGEHLVSLYLNGCQDLSLNNILSNLTKSHPNLQILYIRNLPKLEKVGKFIGTYNFSKLTELYLMDCSLLKSFKIHAPNLHKLQVINCPNLHKLVTQDDNVKQDIGINDYVIEDCPKLITEFNLPSSCFIELLADYADFQASEVDATESLSLMYGEVSRGNYGPMFFGNHRKANEQKQGEARLADFDEHLQTIGISNKYLRNYVTLILIQGAGEDILGRARDLSFAYAASGLVCQKLNAVIRSHVETAGDKLITGISNLKPKIKYNAVNESVCLEFADSLSIYDDNGKKTQLGFAKYGIIVYADHSKLPEFTCNLDLYNSVTVTIAKQRFRPTEIFNPNNIRSLFVETFTTLNDKDFLDKETLSRAEKLAQLMPYYAALHAKLFPELAVSKHGTQNARFAMLYLTKWLMDLKTKSVSTDTTLIQIDPDTIKDFVQIFRKHFTVENHTIRLSSSFEHFADGKNGRIIPKIVTEEFLILHQENQSRLLFN